MRFHVVTIFPKIIDSYSEESIIFRARQKGLVEIKSYNPREIVTLFSYERSELENKKCPGGTTAKYNRVDDVVYGGGPGMVLEALPLLTTIQHIKDHHLAGKKIKVIMTTPRGEHFTNVLAKKFAKGFTDIIIICGRYEGVDARVRRILRPLEVSIGPFVLTGGELPALVMIDSITRQIPGVLGKAESLEDARIASHDVYTRPEVLEWKGKKYKVPPVLLSGDHKKIDAWRKEN